MTTEEQKRAAWLEERRRGLGGSDLGAILGLSPWRTPVDVWMEKTGRSAGAAESLPMRFGAYAEEFVAREYERKTGRRVQAFTTMLHHPAAPILGNVDRLVIPAGAKVASHKGEIRTDRGLECKTENAFEALDREKWGAAGSDEVPPPYLIQCAVYMALTGCEFWDLAVLFGNQEFRIYTLTRDLELEGELLDRARDWWTSHVLADLAPPPANLSDVRKLFPDVKEETKEADPIIRNWARVCEDASAKAAEYQAVADTAKMHLLAFMGAATVLKLDGNRVFRRKMIWKKPYTVEASNYVDARFSTIKDKDATP